MADILARKDGRKIREIPPAVLENKMLRSNNVPDAEAFAEQDGFKTILNCRWCGNKSKEVYIPQFKDGKDDKPVEIVFDYEPCEECKKAWSGMVVIIEVTDTELYPDCLPITSEQDTPLYPTGRHIGVTEAAAQECINKNAKNGMVFFMEEKMFSDIFKEHFKAQSSA